MRYTHAHTHMPRMNSGSAEPLSCTVDGLWECTCCEAVIPGGGWAWKLPNGETYCEECAKSLFRRVAPYRGESDLA